MKLKTILISAGAAVICAALPCYVAITGLAASPTEAVIPTGSIIYDVNGEEYASLSRFDTSADGRAAKYIAEEKSSYLTWFYCVFGNGRSASERLAYILKPEGSPSERISVAKYLEQNYSAEQLSSMLCSAVEFHDGIYGFDNAAAYYFGVSGADLSDEQLRALADIYNSDRFRRLTPTELSEEKHFSDVEFEKDHDSVVLYGDDYVSGVLNELRSKLSENGISDEQAERMIFLDGMEIHTYLDPVAQTALDDTLSAASDDSNFRVASQIMTYDGRIIACFGSIGNDRVDRTVKLLEPGSAIKPLSIYGPAFEQGIINCSSILPDYPFYPEEEWPHNYDFTVDGEVTTAKALRRSKNTTPVFIADRLTPELCYSYMTREGFRNITSGDISLMGMALGYMDSGVTLREMNAAYAVFGNGGYYYAPTFIDKAVCGGETLFTASHEGVKVFSPETAYIMNRILRSNVEMGDGLGVGAYMKGIEVFGKTGTTDDKGIVDNNWFVGGTPELITAVWTGPDDTTMAVSSPPCTILWNMIMSSISCEKTGFDPCEGVTEAEYCTKSGKLKSDSCTETETGWYTIGKLPDICEECKK